MSTHEAANNSVVTVEAELDVANAGEQSDKHSETSLHCYVKYQHFWYAPRPIKLVDRSVV